MCLHKENARLFILRFDAYLKHFVSHAVRAVCTFFGGSQPIYLVVNSLSFVMLDLSAND